MKKITLNKILLSITALFFFYNVSIAQGLMYEVSLKDQVAASSQIIEGKVISKKSFWNESKTRIYTTNTIEVYKIFKGQEISTIEVVTQGGNVDTEFQIVNPSLKLRIGDVGVFTLISHAISFDSSKKLTAASFKAYSSKQGFYKYDIIDNVVANPFSKREGITTTFYSELKDLTKTEFSEINKFDINKKQTLLKKNVSSKSAVAITSFLPTTSTAGTKSVLTITGANFGVQGETSKVEFKDSDQGGGAWFAAYDSQILTWSDTEITVEIPSEAGTGTIRVDPDLSASQESTQILTISYAEINAISSSEPITAFQTQHLDRNGSGGMTWKMFTDFDANTSAKESFLRALETWRCETKINWIVGLVTTVDEIASDNVNIIRFDNGTELDAGVLGSMTTYFAGCVSIVYVKELDLIFDDGVDWEFGPANATGGKHDFESVTVHELGHGHQLGHVIDPSAIMHFSIAANVNNRVLSANDIAGGNDVQSRSTADDSPCILDEMTNYVCATASIEDQILASGITIFPNPANSNLYISNKTYLSLENALIYDVSGRLLLQKDISEYNKTKTIDISSFSQGLYFINISSVDGSTTKRFIVE